MRVRRCVLGSGLVVVTVLAVLVVAPPYRESAADPVPYVLANLTSGALEWCGEGWGDDDEIWVGPSEVLVDGHLIDLGSGEGSGEGSEGSGLVEVDWEAAFGTGMFCDAPEVAALSADGRRVVGRATVCAPGEGLEEDDVCGDATAGMSLLAERPVDAGFGGLAPVADPSFGGSPWYPSRDLRWEGAAALSADGGVVVGGRPEVPAGSDLDGCVGDSCSVDGYWFEEVDVYGWSGGVGFEHLSVSTSGAGGRLRVGEFPVGVPFGWMQEAGGQRRRVVSADGSQVGFVSRAYNLDEVLGDEAGSDLDVFVRDRVAGRTVRVSVLTEGGVSEIDGDVSAPSMSADGRFVVFAVADGVVPAVEGFDRLFVHDRDSDADGVFDEAGAVATEEIELPSGVENPVLGVPAMSESGRWLAVSRTGCEGSCPEGYGDSLHRMWVWDRVEESWDYASLGKQGEVPPRVTLVERGAPPDRYPAAFLLLDHPVHPEVDANAVADLYAWGPQEQWQAFLGAKLGSAKVTAAHASDPVDVTTGNFTQTMVDVAPVGGVWGLEFSRTVNSWEWEGGDLGFGWSSSYGQSLELVRDWEGEVDPSRVRLRMADGQRVVFEWDAGLSGWRRPVGLAADLVGVDVDGEVVSATVRFGDGVSWEFVDGRLVSMSDGQGQSVVVERDGSGVLQRVTALPSGRGLRFWDNWPAGAPDGVIDVVLPTRGGVGDGRRVVYRYEMDPLFDPATGEGYGLGLSEVLRIHYVGEPHGVEEYDVDVGGRVTEIRLRGRNYPVDAVPPVKRLVTNAYRLDGRVWSQVTDMGDAVEFAYDDAAFTTTVTNTASGDETVYHHDVEGRVSGITDARTEQVAREYTASGQLSGFEGRAGVVHRSFYDGEGRLVQRAIPDPDPVSPDLIPDPDPQSGWSRDLGVGWSLEEWTYTDATGSRVETFTDAEGQLSCYEYEGAETIPAEIWQGPCGGAGVPVTVVESSAGLVTRVTDPDGVVAVHVYDPVTKELVSTKVGDRPPTLFGYDAAGQLAWVETPEGERTSYTYYGSGRPKTVSDPLVGVAGSGHVAQQFLWAPDGTPMRATDAAGKATVTSVQWPAGGGREVTVTDPEGVWTRSVFDRSGDLVRVVRAANVGEATPETVYGYGPLGRLESVTDPAGVVTRYGYDVEGRVTEVTVGGPLGDPARTTTTSYDRLGRVVRVEGPVGDVDAVGNPIRSVTTTSYDRLGRVVREVAAPGTGAETVVWTVYDAYGNVRYRVDDRGAPLGFAGGVPQFGADDVVVESGYSAAGRLTDVWQTPPDVVSWSFDRQSALHSSRSYDPVTGWLDSETVPGRADLVTGYDYDDNGRLVKVSGPSGWVETVYDPLGRAVRTVTPTGDAAPEDRATVVRTFDPGGQVATETDPYVFEPGGPVHPSTRAFTYDDAGRLETVTDANEHTVVYGYDRRGNRVTRSAVTDDGGVAVQEWRYDLADRVVWVEDPFDARTSTTYDSSGRPETVTDPTGRVRSTEYWASGLVKRETFAAPSMPTLVHEWWYDSAGNPTKLVDPTGVTSWSRGPGGRVELYTPGSGRAMGYSWSLAGQPREVVYPDGATYRYSHTATGQLDLVEGRTGGGVWVPLADYGYHLATDRLASEVLALVNTEGGPGTRTWGWDPAGRLASYRQEIADGTDLEVSVEYRSDGRVEREVYAAPDATLLTPYDEGIERVYGYDDAGQLVGVRSDEDGVGGFEHETTWTYGTRGNRLSETVDGATTVYAYDAAVRLTATSGVRAGSFGWDAAGRLTGEVPLGGPAVSYTYDSRGRPATVANSAGASTFGYDGQGRWVSAATTTATGTVTAEFAWDPTQRVAQAVELRLGDGTATLGVIRTGQGLHRLGATINNGDGSAVFDWYSFDHRGSTIANRDDVFGDPIVGGPYDYTAFGHGILPAGHEQDGGFFYRGEFQMGGTQLHLRNRDYRTDLGLFTTPDPLDGVDGTPTVANPYHYADNDPLNRVDPLGLRPTETCAGYFGDPHGQDLQDCEVIQDILSFYVPSWRRYSFKIYTNDCGDHPAGQENSAIKGDASRSHLCVSWPAVNVDFVRDPSGLFHRMTSSLWDFYEHIVLHEFGHVVNNNELNLGQRNTFGPFSRWQSADNANGWPAINQLDTWVDILVGEGDDSARESAQDAFDDHGNVDEFLADCIAQGLKPAVFGGYWLRDVSGNSAGCPPAGRTAAVRYVHGGTR